MPLRSLPDPTEAVRDCPIPLIGNLLLGENTLVYTYIYVICVSIPNKYAYVSV